MPPRLRCPPHAGADVAVYDQTSVGPELMLRLVRCRCPWSCSDHTRVEGITLRLDVPGGVAPALEPALRRAIEQCTVHQSIRERPVIEYTINALQEAVLL